MDKLLTADRRKQIAEYIIAHGSTKAGQLAKEFHVSTETIRKDLIYLDDEGIIKKSHGGAQSSLELMERPLQIRETDGVKEKNAIAQKALELIGKQKVIYLDAGSTCAALAKLLYLKKDLLIFTASLRIADILANSENDIYMCGGRLNPKTMALEGFGGNSFFRQINIDIAFLGTSGFKNCNGPTAIALSSADMKRTITEKAYTNIVLTRHAKADTAALVEYANWKDIDYLITDESMNKKEYDRLAPYLNIIQVSVCKR